MRRKPHYLKENYSSETIHECIFYDCESRTELTLEGKKKHILVFGWGAYRRRSQSGPWEAPQWDRFDRGARFWQWVMSKARPKKTTYLWAHNQGFDYITSEGPKALRKLGWEMTDAIIDSPPFIVTYRKGTSKLVLCDSLNIWRMGLKKMGKLTGLEKLEMPSTWSDVVLGDAYCRRDVEIVMKAVCEWADFLVQEDFGKFQLTVASQAMTVYRHRYLNEPILIDNNESALDVARAAYHGGRVECNVIGHRRGHFYLLDINSLYPFVMSINRFPTRLVTVLQQPSIEDVRYVLEKYLACAHVRVRLTTPLVPIKMNHKLIFPTGVFDCYVSTPEVEYLLDNNCLIKCHAVAVYEHSMPFYQFVTDLYGKRIECKLRGDVVEAEHYKLLLNSFSGKWGQNGCKWRTISRTKDLTIGFARATNAWNDEVIDYRRFNGVWQRKDVFPESSNSHPAIAAHITAYGRMELWTLINQMKSEDYLYCDTDAVLCTDHGFDRLKDRIDDTQLGKLKIVGEYSDVRIYGPKDYELDGKRTIKGIRYDAKALDGGRYKQERWANFKGLLRGKSLANILMDTHVKTLRRVYNKGHVTPTGFTRPFHLPEDSGLIGG